MGRLVRFGGPEPRAGTASNADMMTLARQAADSRKSRRRTLAVLFLAALLGLDLLVRCCCAPASAAPAAPEASSSCPGEAGHCDQEGTPAGGAGGAGCSCEPSPVLLHAAADPDEAPRGFAVPAILAPADAPEPLPPGSRREKVGWLSPLPDRGLSPPGLRSPPSA